MTEHRERQVSAFDGHQLLDDGTVASHANDQFVDHIGRRPDYAGP